jgi:hypothetical protein
MTTAKKAAPKKKAATVKKAAPAPEASAEETPEEEKVRLPVNPVKPGDVKLEREMHNTWACFLPSHYNQDQIEDQKTWTFMASKFKDMDEVCVTAEDGSWRARAVVRRTVSMEINVQVYDMIELSAPMIAKEVTIGDDYVIRHFGAIRKFAVCNRANGTVVKEGFNTQVQAMKYVTDHIQAKTAVGT